jgi:hypothetical protein
VASAFDLLIYAYLLCGLFLAIMNWRHRPASDPGIDAFNVAGMHVAFWVALGPLVTFAIQLKKVDR